MKNLSRWVSIGSILLITSLTLASNDFNVYPIFDFTGGLNTKLAPNLLAKNQCSDCQNVLFDDKYGFVRRDGYSYASSLSSNYKWSNGMLFNTADGTKRVIIQKGTNLYESLDNFTWTSIKDGLSTSQICRFKVYYDLLWITNQVDGVMAYNGSSVSSYTYIPKGKYIEEFNEHLFLGNTSDENSTVYFSDLVLGAKDPNAWDIRNTLYFGRNDGDEITGMKVWNGVLWVFKKNSIWGLSGEDEDSFVKRQYSNQYGCLDDGTIQEYSNMLVFLSKYGVVGFDGSQVKILSTNIEPSLNELSLTSSKEQKWIVTSDADFNAGTKGNTEVSNGELRMSATSYKLWNSSITWGEIVDTTTLVNIDTISFSQNGYICADVKLTDDFSGSLSSSWTAVQNTNIANNTWTTSPGFLTYYSTGGSAYNHNNKIYFNADKQYGKLRFDCYAYQEYNTGRGIGFVKIKNTEYVYDDGYFLDPFHGGWLWRWKYNDEQEEYRFGNTAVPGYSYTQFQATPYSTGTTGAVTRTALQGYGYYGIQSTYTYILMRDYSNNIGYHGNDGFRFISDDNPVKFEGSQKPGFVLFGVGFLDNFYCFSSTYCTYISTSFDTGGATPNWVLFGSSICTWGISDTGFQTRVSADNSTWDSWIGISSGQVPANASKRYIQFKATITVQDVYQYQCPEIRNVYISHEGTGSYISANKYVGNTITKWGTFEVDDNGGGIGYFIAGASTTYNLSIASYIPINDGGDILLSTDSVYVKWKSTFSSTNDSRVYNVTMKWFTGNGFGSDKFYSAVFDNRYWLSCSSNSLTNNMIYTMDSNLAWSRFSGINASYMYEFDDENYFTSSSDNNVFRFSDVATDSGTVSNAYWKSGFLDFLNPNVDKWLRFSFVTGLQSSGSFINYDYQIDDSTVTKTKCLDFTNSNNLPINFDSNLFCRNAYIKIRSTGSFEIQGLSIYTKEKDLNPIR